MLPLLLGIALASPVSDDQVARCDAAVVAQDVEALQQCVEAWVIAAPDAADTDWYAFHLALLRGNATAANAARTRALARGLSDDRAAVIQRTALPPNPWLERTHVFMGAILALGLAGMVWARVRAMRQQEG